MGCVIDGVGEAVRRDLFGFGWGICLQREHIGGGKLPAGFEYVIDARRAPRRFPFYADRIQIAVGSDSAVRGGDDSRRRVVDVRKFLERNVGTPLVGVIRAAYRKAAVSGGADGSLARGV